MITSMEAKEISGLYENDNMDIVNIHLGKIETLVISAAKRGELGCFIDIIEPYEIWRIVLRHLNDRGFAIMYAPSDYTKMWLHW